MAKAFRAYRVEQTDDGTRRSIQELSTDDLPAGNVLVRVHYSCLNYKDAMSATGSKAVTREFPHTPGIDAAGVVEASDSADWSPGDEVLVTSYDLGMNTDGALADYIRVPAQWVVRRPETLAAREAMIYGTAGFTAALCVQELVHKGLKPSDGQVLVSGATGGVGSIAVALLAKLGYTVVAGSGKADAADWLKSLGAAETIGREELIDDSGRPLLKSRWAGSVDTVGGDILATTLKTMAYRGAIACCGLVASPKLETTVMPFILRGVSLLGVDSQNTPRELREATWAKLAGDWKLDNLEAMTTEIGLDDVDGWIDRLLEGGVRGRVLVALEG